MIDVDVECIITVPAPGKYNDKLKLDLWIKIKYLISTIGRYVGSTSPSVLLLLLLK